MDSKRGRVRNFLAQVLVGLLGVGGASVATLLALSVCLGSPGFFLQMARICVPTLLFGLLGYGLPLSLVIERFTKVKLVFYCLGGVVGGLGAWLFHIYLPVMRGHGASAAILHVLHNPADYFALSLALLGGLVSALAMALSYQIFTKAKYKILKNS